MISARTRGSLNGVFLVAPRRGALVQRTSVQERDLLLTLQYAIQN